jgi:superfamily II DNA/RNA helicase
VITIGTAGKAVDRIQQVVLWVAGGAARNQQLYKDLRSTAPPMIVFCNQRNTCDAVEKVELSSFCSCTPLTLAAAAEE